MMGVVDDVDRTDCDSSSPVVSDTLNISGEDSEDMLLAVLVELFVELLVVLLPLVMLREPALVMLREPLPMRCRDIYIVLC